MIYSCTKSQKQNTGSELVVKKSPVSTTPKKNRFCSTLCVLLNVKGVDRWVAGYWYCMVAQVFLDLRETATITFNLIYS